jgi:hypothetical protein
MMRTADYAEAEQLQYAVEGILQCRILSEYLDEQFAGEYLDQVHTARTRGFTAAVSSDRRIGSL